MALLSPDAFDPLPDELLQNILGRVLWRPNDKGPGKAKQRVQLETVCKRFQRAVCMSGNLDWDLTENAESQEIFVRYVRSREVSMATLERLAIRLKGKPHGMASLLPTIPQALETLQHVHIVGTTDSMFFEDDKSVTIPWNNIVFTLLSTCKKLQVLEVILWGYAPSLPSIKLDLSTPLEPLESLSSLLLYGFCVPSASLASCIQNSLPNLKSLELHSDPRDRTSSLESTDLEKLFLWGSSCERFDIVDPAGAQVPNSMTMLLNMLRTGDAELQNHILRDLYYLLDSSSVQKVLAKVPWFLPRLLLWLKLEKAVDPDRISDVLLRLTSDSNAQKHLSGDPTNLLALVDFVVEQGSSRPGRLIAPFLAKLFGQAETQKLLESNSSCVKRLVGFAIWNVDLNVRTVEEIVKILAQLSPGADEVASRLVYRNRAPEFKKVEPEEVETCLLGVLYEVGHARHVG